MATSEFARLPGFRDFPPEEFALRRHVQESWRRVARRYGFLEYDGPPLESLDLYVEKSGEEIVGQLYTFTDKGGRAVAMRPEMTPSLASVRKSTFAMSMLIFRSPFVGSSGESGWCLCS